MIFTTQIELNITVKDTSAKYSTEYEQMLLDHAKLMYEGKCRDGQYIKSIDSLVKRSLPNIILRDPEAKVRVYIVVNATVIRYDPYDIITDIKINKIIPAGKIGNFDMLECRNDHVVALMKIKMDIDQFHVGDIIPIRVGQSMYKIGNEHILVNGYPFIPYVPDQVYYSIGELSSDDKKYYTEKIAPLIDRELKRKESLDQTQWNKFSDLLYPFKTETTPQITANILDVNSIHKGLFGVDYHTNLSKLLISSAMINATESITIVHEDTKTILTRLAFPFVKWLETINNLTSRYNSDESFNKLEYIWNLYEEHKM